MAAGACCTWANLPLWPFYYQRLDQGEGEEEPGRALKRGWYPFLVNFCRYSTAASSVILFRIVSLPAAWAVDIVWPIFHISKRTAKDNKGGEGWVVSVRLLPLVWIYLSQRRVLVAIAPCIIFYKSFESNVERRTVLHVFPLLSIVVTHQQGKRWFFLSILYLFYYRTIHTPDAQNANHFKVYRAVVLFPFVWHFQSESGQSTTTICGIIWLSRDRSASYFVLFPVFWLFWDGESFMIFAWVFTLVTQRGTIRGLVILPLMVYIRTNDGCTLSVLLLYWLRLRDVPGNAAAAGGQQQRSVFTTLVPLFLYYHSPAAPRKTALGVLYVFWFARSTEQGSLTWSVLPFFYHHSAKWRRVVGCLNVWVFETTARALWVVVFPLLYFKRTPPPQAGYGSGGCTYVCWLVPIFYIKRKVQKELTCWLFPIFYYHSHLSDNGNREVTVGVLFLFWFSRDFSGSVLVVILPLGFVNRESSGTIHMLLFPVWYSKKNHNNAGSLALLPLFFYAWPGDQDASPKRTFSALLLFWLRHGPNHFLVSVFPFVWFSRSGQPGEKKTLFSLFLLFWWRKTVKGTNILLLPFVWLKIRSRGGITVCLLPVFFYARKDGGRRNHLTVFPLFHVSHTTGGDAFYSVLFLFWWWRVDNKWSLCCIDAFWLNGTD